MRCCHNDSKLFKSNRNHTFMCSHLQVKISSFNSKEMSMILRPYHVH
uniref:Uncharacterized protein n=1 Tax=Rhizophora mucronata TaxID=61149 RepID=A0A2P2MVV6_RHIMU